MNNFSDNLIKINLSPAGYFQSFQLITVCKVLSFTSQKYEKGTLRRLFNDILIICKAIAFLPAGPYIFNSTIIYRATSI